METDLVEFGVYDSYNSVDKAVYPYWSRKVLVKETLKPTTELQVQCEMYGMACGIVLRAGITKTVKMKKTWNADLF